MLIKYNMEIENDNYYYLYNKLMSYNSVCNCLRLTNITLMLIKYSY